jgi:hypothetical protein
LSFPRILFIGAIALFAVIGVFAALKKTSKKEDGTVAKVELKNSDAKVAKLPEVSSLPFQVAGDFP